MSRQMDHPACCGIGPSAHHTVLGLVCISIVVVIIICHLQYLLFPLRLPSFVHLIIRHNAPHRKAAVRGCTVFHNQIREQGSCTSRPTGRCESGSKIKTRKGIRKSCFRSLLPRGTYSAALPSCRENPHWTLRSSCARKGSL